MGREKKGVGLGTHGFEFKISLTLAIQDTIVAPILQWYEAN